MSHFNASPKRFSRRRFRSCSRYGLENLEPRVLLHAEMLLDYNAEPVGLHPQNLTIYQDELYFTLPASEMRDQAELWKTDGTETGTKMVSELNGESVSLMAVAHDRLLLIRQHDHVDYYLDAFDGSAIVELEEVLPGSPYFSQFDIFTTGAGRTYVHAFGRSEFIWETDLTPEGTHRVQWLNSGWTGHRPVQTASEDGLFFANRLPGECCETDLWFADLTVPEFEPRLLTSETAGHPQHFVSGEDHTYFSVELDNVGRQLWYSDGTAAGTTFVTSLRFDTLYAPPTEMTIHQGILYFLVEDDAGTQLWRHDLERGLQPLTSSGNVAGNLHNTGDYLYYTVQRANGNTDSVALYQVQADRMPTLTASFPADGFSVNQAGKRLLISATDQHLGLQLWATSGGPVQRLTALPEHDRIEGFYEYQNGFAFVASGPTGSTLWYSNAAEVTRQAGAVPGDADQFIALHDRLLFTGSGANGDVLWKFDGEAVSTLLDTHYQTESTFVESFFDAGQKPLILVTDDRSTASDHWRPFDVYTSWGTAATTDRMGENVLWVTTPLWPRFVAASDNQVFVSGRWGDGPYQLNRLNLTTLEVDRVRDPSVVSQADPRVGVIDESMYYLEEPDWIRPLEFDGERYWPVETNHGSYFVTNSRNKANVMYRVDESGNAEPLFDLAELGIPQTSRHFPLNTLAGKLYFTATHPDYGREVWVSDGTARGTQLLKDINPGKADGGLSGFTRHHDQLYFTAFHPDFGVELWRTDGTPEGTLLVHDANPGPAGSAPRHLGGVGDTFYFTADDGTHGREIWAALPEGPSTGIAGDLNEDGLLSELDFALLRAEYGKEATDSHADMNDDGRVDFDDFLLLSAEFR